MLIVAIVVVLVVLVVGAAGLGLRFFVKGDSEVSEPRPVSGSAGSDGPTDGPTDATTGDPTKLTTDYTLVLGPEDAPHTIVVYEDFLCPFCKVFADASDDGLRELAESGKARIEYRPASILTRAGTYSSDALNALFVVREAAGTEVALAFQDLLFADQPPETGPFPDDDDLVDLAVQAGAEESAVRPAIESGAQQAAVEAATQKATDAGITSYPTVQLDGTPFQRGGNWQATADQLIARLK